MLPNATDHASSGATVGRDRLLPGRRSRSPLRSSWPSIYRLHAASASSPAPSPRTNGPRRCSAGGRCAPEVGELGDRLRVSPGWPACLAAPIISLTPSDDDAGDRPGAGRRASSPTSRRSRWPRRPGLADRRGPVAVRQGGGERGRGSPNVGWPRCCPSSVIAVVILVRGKRSRLAVKPTRGRLPRAPRSVAARCCRWRCCAAASCAVLLAATSGGWRAAVIQSMRHRLRAVVAGRAHRVSSGRSHSRKRRSPASAASCSPSCSDAVGVPFPLGSPLRRA